MLLGWMWALTFTNVYTPKINGQENRTMLRIKTATTTTKPPKVPFDLWSFSIVNAVLISSTHGKNGQQLSNCTEYLGTGIARHLTNIISIHPDRVLIIAIIVRQT